VGKEAQDHTSNIGSPPLKLTTPAPPKEEGVDRESLGKEGKSEKVEGENNSPVLDTNALMLSLRNLGEREISLERERNEEIEPLLLNFARGRDDPVPSHGKLQLLTEEKGELDKGRRRGGREGNSTERTFTCVSRAETARGKIEEEGGEILGGHNPNCAVLFH